MQETRGTNGKEEGYHWVGEHKQKLVNKEVFFQMLKIIRT